MRAKEFIQEAAPTLGAPTAAQNQKLAKLANLGSVGSVAPGAKKDGFLSNVAAGFKQGMGMDPTKSLAQGVAVQGLSKLGMTDTATSVSDLGGQQTKKPGDPMGQETDTETDPSKMKMPLPGTVFRDPKLGNVKVLPNAPGQKGLHLDTSKTLGMPVYVDPKDLARK